MPISYLRDKTQSLPNSSGGPDQLLLSYYKTSLINRAIAHSYWLMDDGSGVYLNTIIYCFIDVLLITLLSAIGCLIM